MSTKTIKAYEAYKAAQKPPVPEYPQVIITGGHCDSLERTLRGLTDRQLRGVILLGERERRARKKIALSNARWTSNQGLIPCLEKSPI